MAHLNEKNNKFDLSAPNVWPLDIDKHKRRIYTKNTLFLMNLTDGCFDTIDWLV